MAETFAIGIDLGTSNSVTAIAGTAEGDEAVRVVEVTQTLGASSLGEKSTLPSALYIPAEGELPPEALRLPWHEEPQRFVTGEFARERGALVPERYIASAKSWLCNPHVNRREPILPWRSRIAHGKASPLEVSTRLLRHLRENLLFQWRQHAGERSLEDAEIVLTVPASFDEAARNLTHEAAEAAGWGRVVLLEEPQAAFYSWIAQSGGRWREQVQPGDLVLVCDIGGGTADFTLIAVSEQDGSLELNRISVGDHILLGGDNMDLALAYTVQGKLEAEGHIIDNWQFLSIVHTVRAAKERLFSDLSIDEIPISIPGRGSSLFKETLTSKITRAQSEVVVLEGYFPLTEPHEMPDIRPSVGLQEYGLPYASDPAFSKQLARFLADSLTNVRSDPQLQALVGHGSEDQEKPILVPDKVLFNGGVLKSPLIRARLRELLSRWAGREVVELEGADLDLAVARGAAYYGSKVRSGEGLRIRAGTGRSYYLGIESSMPAVPGIKPPLKGLCVVPQGTEEGEALTLEENEFGLVTGETVQFRFFSSNTRAGDQVGTIIPNAERELEESPSLEASIEGERKGEVVPVRLHAYVTELGTLELWMEHVSSQRKWKLEFNVRPRDGAR